MMRSSLYLAAASVSVLILCGVGTYAEAAGVKKVDSLLESAIRENAQPTPAPEPEITPEEAQVLAEMPADPEPAPEPEPAQVAPEEAAPVMAEDQESRPSARGIRLGSWLLTPSLRLEGAYDSNIMAEVKQAENDDYVWTARPDIRVELMESRHQSVFEAGYEAKRYADNSAENTDGYHAGFKGFVAAGDHVKLPYDLAYSLRHEDRAEDLTRLLPDNPMKDESFGGKLGIEYKPGAFSVALLGDYGRELFDDGLIGAVSVIRRDANRHSWGGTMRVGYDVAEEHQVYVQGSYGQRNYDRRSFTGTSFTGVQRDSNFYEARAGLATSYEGVVTGDVNIGYRKQNFDNATISDVDTLVAHAGLGLHPAEKTAVRLDVDRNSYEDEAIIDPILRTTADLSIEQQVLSNVVLGIGGFYEKQDFKNSSREDETLGARVFGDLKMSDRFGAGVEYRYSTRDSGAAGLDYDRHLALVHLTGEL